MPSRRDRVESAPCPARSLRIQTDDTQWCSRPRWLYRFPSLVGPGRLCLEVSLRLRYLSHPLQRLESCLRLSSSWSRTEPTPILLALLPVCPASASAGLRPLELENCSYQQTAAHFAELIARQDASESGGQRRRHWCFSNRPFWAVADCQHGAQNSSACSPARWF